MMQQFHTQEYPTANRNYKDRLFRFVFKNKKAGGQTGRKSPVWNVRL
jgi:hypothetical protein